MGHHRLHPEGGRRLDDRELLGELDVAGRDHRVVLLDEPEDLLGRRHEARPFTDHGDARSRKTELPPIDHRGEGRHPDDLRARAQGDLDRGGIQPAHLEVAADAAEDPQADDRLLHEDRHRAGRIGVALQHDRRHPQGVGLGDRLRGVDAARPVGIGSVMAVHVDRSDDELVGLGGHGLAVASADVRCQAPAARSSPGKTTAVEKTSSARARAARAAVR